MSEINRNKIDSTFEKSNDQTKMEISDLQNEVNRNLYGVIFDNGITSTAKSKKRINKGGEILNGKPALEDIVVGDTAAVKLKINEKKRLKILVMRKEKGNKNLGSLLNLLDKEFVVVKKDENGVFSFDGVKIKIGRGDMVLLKESNTNKDTKINKKILKLPTEEEMKETFGGWRDLNGIKGSVKIMRSIDRLESVASRILEKQKYKDEKKNFVEGKTSVAYANDMGRLKMDYAAESIMLINDIQKESKAKRNLSENFVVALSVTVYLYWLRFGNHEFGHRDMSLAKGHASGLEKDKKLHTTYFASEGEKNYYKSYILGDIPKKDYHDIAKEGLAREQRLATELVQLGYEGNVDITDAGFFVGYLLNKIGILNYISLVDFKKELSRERTALDPANIVKLNEGDVTEDDMRRNAILSFLLSGGTINLLRQSIDKAGLIDINGQKFMKLEVADGEIYLPEIETDVDFEKGMVNIFVFFYKNRYNGRFSKIRVSPIQGNMQFETELLDDTSISVGDERFMVSKKVDDKTTVGGQYDEGGYKLGGEIDIPFDFSEKVPLPPKLSKLFEENGVDPESVQIPTQEIISQLQIMAIAMWDKIGDDTKAKLGFRYEGGKINLPEKYKGYFTQNMSIIRNRVNLLLDTNRLTEVVTATAGYEQMFGDQYSMNSVLFMNAVGFFARKMFGVNVGDRTISGGVFVSADAENTDIDYGPAFKMVNWSSKGTGTGYGMDFGMFSGLHLSLESKSKIFGERNTEFRVGRNDFMVSIFDLQPIVINNPGENVSDLITGEIFAKYGEFFQSVVKNPKDKIVVMDILIKLQSISSKQGKGIFMDEDFLEDMKIPKKLRRFQNWLTSIGENDGKKYTNLDTIRNTPRGNIIFKNFDEGGNNRYDNSNGDIEVNSSSYHMLFAQNYNSKGLEYDEKREQTHTNIILEENGMQDTIAKLKENFIDLEIEGNISQNQLKGLKYFMDRLSHQTMGLEKIRHRKIRIVDEKIFQMDISYEDNYKTVIGIEKNVLDELFERGRTESIDISIHDGAFVHQGLLAKHKNKMIATAKAYGLDLTGITIVSDEDEILEDEDDEMFVNKFDIYNDNGQLIMSDFFVNKLLEGLQDGDEGNWYKKQFIEASEKTNISSLNRFDKDLTHILKTQDKRLALASREMGRSQFYDFRPATDMYLDGNSIKIEYTAYDVMNRFQYNIEIELNEKDNVSIIIKGKGKQRWYNLDNPEQIKQLKKYYPGVMKMLLGMEGVTYNSKKKYLNGVVPMMVKGREMMNLSNNSK